MSSPSMDCQIEHIGECALVRLTGQISLSDAEKLREPLARLAEQKTPLIVLDLSAVTFVDSSGLGAIVSSLKMLRGQGQLALCGMPNTVMSTFKLTRMDKVFRIFPSHVEAIAALSNKA